MFGSKSIAAHMVRGAVAAALIVWALSSESSHPALAAAAAVVAVVAMKGCPMCWTIGLLETIGARLGRS